MLLFTLMLKSLETLRDSSTFVSLAVKLATFFRHHTDELAAPEREGENHTMTELNAQDLLDWQHLYDWTAGKPKGSKVGIACTNSRCPIANYLGDMTNKLWSVGPSIRAMNGSTRERLDKPAWIQELMNCVDGDADAHDSMPVTREDFLRYLEEVKHATSEEK